ncbi:MAG: acetolactate synthase small subunit [Eubacterium sp.]|jgi:acetolactate synthase-1/3 small subunit|nr:acetolactate synthase small subunit [Eubacterium sp.]
MKTKVLSLYVENTAGVLSRVSGMFSRRGYNIDSLSVGVTEDPKYSRMTVVVTGDDKILTQIKSQLNKLEDVKSVVELKNNESVTRELVLIKIKADATERQQIISVANVYRANIVDVSQDSIMVEITGNNNKVEAFKSLLEGFEIQEMVRTGITGLIRGRAESDD